MIIELKIFFVEDEIKFFLFDNVNNLYLDYLIF